MYPMLSILAMVASRCRACWRCSAVDVETRHSWLGRPQVSKRIVQTDSSSMELSVSGEDDEDRLSSPARPSEPEPRDHAILQVLAICKHASTLSCSRRLHATASPL